MISVDFYIIFKLFYDYHLAQQEGKLYNKRN